MPGRRGQALCFATWVGALTAALLVGWEASPVLRLLLAPLPAGLAWPALCEAWGWPGRSVQRVRYGRAGGWSLQLRGGRRVAVRLAQPWLLSGRLIWLRFTRQRGEGWSLCLLRGRMEPCAWRTLQLHLKQAAQRRVETDDGNRD